MDATAENLIDRLRTAPDDATAFAALRAHYQRLGDHASLANLLEGWARRNRDRASAAAAYAEAADIAARKLRDPERAIGFYERALERRPQHREAAARLQYLLEQAGDERRLIGALERRAQALQQANADVRMRARVHMEAGQVWHARLGRTDRALHNYRQAFELDPSLVPAIYAARQIYEEAGNVHASVELLGLEARAETDPVRRVALLREFARLTTESLNEPEAGIHALRAALQGAPGDLALQHDLASALLAHGARLAQPNGDAARREAAELFFQMAQNVGGEHAAAYCNTALDARPDHHGALHLLEHLASQRGQTADLPRRWVAYLEVAPQAADAPALRKRLALAYLDHGQDEDAERCLLPLLELEDTEAAELLADIYRRQGQAERAAQALAVAANNLEGKRRVGRLRQLVSVLIKQGEHAQAVERAREILDLEPSDGEAMALLEDDLRRRGDYLALRDLLVAASRLADAPLEGRRHRLREVAALNEQRLNDIDGAVGAWRAVAALDPSDNEAMQSLRRLLARAERWDDLAQVLERGALSTNMPGEAVELLTELAALHRDRREDAQGAVDALRRLLELRPEDERVRADLCDALMTAGADDEARPFLEQRIAESNGQERLDLLRRLARLLEDKLDDAQGAYPIWTQVLDEEPADAEALDRMERIDAARGEFERVLDKLSYRAEMLVGVDRAEMLERMGEIADEKLSDLDRAAEYYRSALSLAPTNTSILDATCDVFERTGRIKDLVRMLREAAQQETEEENRLSLLKRMANILQDRVRNPSAAAEVWTEVLRIEENEDALRYLYRHARRRIEGASSQEEERHATEQAVSLAERLANVSRSDSDRRDIELERAQLLAEGLGRKEDAAHVLENLLENLAPDDLTVLENLERLCEERGDDQALARTLQKQLNAQHDPDAKALTAQRLVDLYDRLGTKWVDLASALRVWTEAKPEEAIPRLQLAQLLSEQEQWSDLRTVLDELSRVDESPEARSEHAREAARLSHERLQDLEGAWSRLESLAPSDPKARSLLERIARESGRAVELAERYVELAQGSDEQDAQRVFWIEAANIYEKESRFERAMEATLRAFTIDWAGEELLGDVDRLGRAAGAWERLAEVYEELLRHTEQPHLKARVLMQHAAVLAGPQNETGAALDCALRACSLAPEADDMLAEAEKLAYRAERVEELLIVYDRRRQHASSAEVQFDAALRAARLCGKDLRDAERATPYLRHALNLSEGESSFLERLESVVAGVDEGLGDAKGMRQALVGQYRQLAGATKDEKRARCLYGRASDMLERELKLPGEALELLVEALEQLSDDPSLERLIALGLRTQQRQRVLRTLDACIQDAVDANRLAYLLRRKGQLLESQADQRAEAVAAYRRLCELPTCTEADREHFVQCLQALKEPATAPAPPEVNGHAVASEWSPIEEEELIQLQDDDGVDGAEGTLPEKRGGSALEQAVTLERQAPEGASGATLVDAPARPEKAQETSSQGSGGASKKRPAAQARRTPTGGAKQPAKKRGAKRRSGSTSARRKQSSSSKANRKSKTEESEA